MISKDPLGILVLAVGVSLTGAFVLALHTGISMREGNPVHYNANFRGAPVGPSTFVGDLARGGNELRARTVKFFDSAFGSPAAQPPAVKYAAALDWNRDGETAEERPPRGSSFSENYEEQYGGASASPYSGSGGAGGEAAAAGGGESAAVPGPRAKPGPGFDKAAGAPRGEKNAPPIQRSFGGRPSNNEGGMAALRHSYASLAGTDAGGRSSGSQSASSGGTWAKNSGGSSGRASWDKGGGGGAMDAAMDGLRGGAAGSYNSAMKSGASAVASAASAAGGSAPAASGSKDASAAGGGAAGGSAAGDAKKETESSTADTGDYYDYNDYSSAAPEETDLFKSVVTEKLNGAKLKSVSEDDITGYPDPGMLKAGALSVEDETKGALPGDPAKFTELSEKRKQELKKEIHVFLKKVENQYDPMTDIFSTPCSLTQDVCAAHGLTEKYITMTTGRAKVVLAVKYANERWHIYTVAFTVKPS